MVELNEEKNFAEHFTTLRWVKWSRRKPDFNGSITIRWYDAYTSNGLVYNKQLIKVGDEKAYTSKDNEGNVLYDENQLQLLETVYWLEEIINYEEAEKYLATL